MASLDWSRLPSLTALRAFAAAAEHGSFSAAARELNVTHAAVAQQVRQLETRLRLPLVHRAGRGLALTEEGRELARALDEGFGVIRDALDRIGQDSAQRPLTITTVPSFAERWLVPRLKGFWQAHPDIAIALRPDYKVVDMRRERIDIAIRYGRGTWPDGEGTFLVSARLIVVGAPALVGDGTNLSPEDLSRLPWVDEEATMEQMDWLEAHGITPPARLAAALPNDDLAMAAAREGVGLYLASAPLVAEDVRRGSLVVVFDPQDDSPGFHIVTLPGPQRPAARTFIKWLKAAV